MNAITKSASLVALVVTLVPSVLYFLGMIGAEQMKWIALAGTIGWFITTPMWMGRAPDTGASYAE